MSPPVNNVPPADAHAANTDLQGGKINQCSTSLTITIMVIF